MNRRALPFWLLTAAIFCGLTLPRLVTEGMFLDGMIYAAVSRNLAAGYGSFWKPYYSETLFSPFFADHPPLVFWIQSLFFRVFGDHYIVEALYSFTTALVAGILIVALWRLLTAGHRELSVLSWLGVFFWTTVPQVCWSYSNNMLENTLAVFMLVAVYFLVKCLIDGRMRALYVVLSGIVICLGALSKGPLAFFPVAVIGFYWLTERRITYRAALWYSLLLVFTIGGVFAILWSVDDARVNISRYIEAQLVPSMSGHRGATATRFVLVGELVEELAIMMTLCAAVLVIARARRITTMPADGSWRAALLMIAVGAAGSLPLVASPRQNAFYLIPAFPFFAVGFGLLAAPAVSAFVGKIRVESRGFRGFVLASAAVLGIVLTLSLARTGRLERRSGMTMDVKMIGQVVPRNSVVTICDSMRKEWKIFALFARYSNISLDWEHPAHEFAVTLNNCALADLDKYEEVDLDTSSLRLYRLKALPPENGRSRRREISP